MTKVVNNKNFKRVTATILAVIVLLGTVFVMPVNAVGKSVTVTFDYCYDTAGNIIKYVEKTKAPNGIIVMPSFKTAVFKDSHRWNTNEDNVVFPETVIDSMPVFWNA